MKNMSYVELLNACINEDVIFLIRFVGNCKLLGLPFSVDYAPNMLRDTVTLPKDVIRDILIITAQALNVEYTSKV